MIFHIKIDRLKGFIFGSTSSCFTNFTRDQSSSFKKDPDVWKYLTLVTDEATTIDLIFTKLADTVNFITSLSQVMLDYEHRDSFVGLTNPNFVKMLLIKLKLQKMAQLRKISLHALFLRALYLSASSLLPEETFFEIKTKNEQLDHLKSKTYLY